MTAALEACGSPWNAAGVAAAGGRRVELFDLTLESDGEEMAGVAFTSADRRELAERLDAAGVDRLGLLGASPMPRADEIADAAAIRAMNLRTPLFAFTKTAAEIDLAAELRLTGAVVLIAVNRRFFPLGTTLDDVVDAARGLAKRARSHGLHTTVMAMDATRAPAADLERFVAAVAPGVDELAVADSMGVASPWGMEALIRAVRGWTATPLQVHCHDHGAVAVANALAAVRAGADVVHATVNGLGEFAGLAALEELAVALPMHLHRRTGIDTERLTALSRFVAAASGVALPPHKPVTGAGAFVAPETEEIQTALIDAAGRGLLEPALTLPPRAVGQRFCLALGRNCGAHAVAFVLERHGLRADPTTLDALAGAVRARLADRHGYALLEEEALLALVDASGLPVSPLA
jgi:isopropylmalate/homocitrate/citramalate synthase